jgi:hypothetical protein
MKGKDNQDTKRKHHPVTRPIPAYRKTLNATAAKALNTASIIAVDQIFQDIDLLNEPGNTFENGFLGTFYPHARLPRYTSSVVRKLYLCIVLVGWQLAQHERIQHACVAEELAGHILIEEAKVQLEIEGNHADYSSFEDEFFEDLDFEMLFDPAYDG